MSDLACRHGGLRRTCEMCDLTVENFSLRRALADARADLIRLQAVTLKQVDKWAAITQKADDEATADCKEVLNKTCDKFQVLLSARDDEIAALQARIAELEAEVAEDYDEGLPCACRWERAPRGVPCSTTGVRLQVCMTHQELEARVEGLSEGIRLYREVALPLAGEEVLIGAWERAYGKAVPS